MKIMILILCLMLGIQANAQNHSKAKVCVQKHSALDFLKKMDLITEMEKDASDSILKVRNREAKEGIRPNLLLSDSCHYARYVLYSPMTGDDIHVELEVVFKRIGQDVKIISKNIQLTGALAKNALFSKVFDEAIIHFFYSKKRNVFGGDICGNLCYFSGDQEKKVYVGRVFTLKF